MKYKIVEVLSAIVIVIIFVLSFSFTFDTLSGKSLMQIAVRDRILLDQYSATRAYVILGVSLVLGIFSLVVLLYPVRREVYSSLERGLGPIFDKLGFIIVNGKIRRKS